MQTRNSAKTARSSRALALTSALTLAAVLSGCSNQSTALDPTADAQSRARGAAVGPVVYDQVEFLGNPLVSEVTIVKANHDRYNRTQPYNTAEFGPQSLAFINSFRGSDPTVANTLGAVLYPDMLIVESSRSRATSGWLSWALANGWGGRNLSDDVVDAGLSAIFGKIVSPIGAFCDNGQLPLCTDNVPRNDKPFGITFPYLAAPTTVGVPTS